jgi:hypothetical protein
MLFVTREIEHPPLPVTQTRVEKRKVLAAPVVVEDSRCKIDGGLFS